MYWLGLTDIAQEGVWLDNYGNEVDMSAMSATIDNAGGTQHCLVWFLTFTRQKIRGLSDSVIESTWLTSRLKTLSKSQKPSVRRDL